MGGGTTENQNFKFFNAKDSSGERDLRAENPQKKIVSD